MTEAWVDMSIKLPQGSRDNLHPTWSERDVQDGNLHVKTHALQLDYIWTTNVVNGRVQPLHTQHVKLIEFESHGVFYLDMDLKIQL